jgi:hypothetical protein
MHSIIEKTLKRGLVKGGPGSGKHLGLNSTKSNAKISVPVPKEHEAKGYSAAIQFENHPQLGRGQQISHHLYHQGKHVASGKSNVVGDGKLSNIKAISPEHQEVLMHAYHHYTK